MARTNFDAFTDDAEYECKTQDSDHENYDGIFTYPADMLYWHRDGFYCEHCHSWKFNIYDIKGRSLSSEIRLGKERGICHRTLSQPITEFIVKNVD